MCYNKIWAKTIFITFNIYSMQTILKVEMNGLSLLRAKIELKKSHCLHMYYIKFSKDTQFFFNLTKIIHKKIMLIH